MNCLTNYVDNSPTQYLGNSILQSASTSSHCNNIATHPSNINTNTFGNHQNISILLNNNSNTSSSIQQFTTLNTCHQQFNDYSTNYISHHQPNSFNLQSTHDFNNPASSDEFNNLLEGLDDINNNHHSTNNNNNNNNLVNIHHPNVFNNHQVKNEYIKYPNIDHINFDHHLFSSSNNNVDNYQIQHHLPIQHNIPLQHHLPIQNHLPIQLPVSNNNKSVNDFEIQSNSVDILNKVLSNADLINLHIPGDNQLTGYNSSILNNNSDENDDDSDGYYGKKRCLDPKMKNKKKEEKISCNVCGCPSSGYHYGSHTCEACKLFFRRTVKNGRKIAFNECKNKVCPIDYKNRSNCSECRYKKCIAVGMSMSRSRFGRHTQRTGSTYPSNTGEELVKFLSKAKDSIFHVINNSNLYDLNRVIVNFYECSTEVLTKKYKNMNSNNTGLLPISKVRSNINLVQTSPSSSQSSLSSSSLSEISSLITSNSNRSSFDRMNNLEYIYNETIKLPECVLVFFCVLFDIKTDFINGSRLCRVKKNYDNFLKSKTDLILKHNAFVDLLKIGLFIKSLDSLTDNNVTNKNQQLLQIESFDKRLTDLMRSEFALFKFDSANSTDFQSYLGLLCSGLDQILIQNMTIREMEKFFIVKFN